MKNLNKLGWLSLGLVSMSLIMSCSLVSTTHKIKTHFSVGTQASVPRTLGAQPGVHPGASSLPSTKQLARTDSVKLQRPINLGGGSAGSRELYASTDVQDITFSLKNKSHPEYGEDFSDVVDPSYPEVDLILSPGDTYIAQVVVNTTNAAPGHSVGITQYGDTKEFTVPPDADWLYPFVVELLIKPSSAYVFLPGLVSSGGKTYVKYYDQADAGQTVGQLTLLSTAILGTPHDKFFYGPDGSLYFFSYASSKVYIWHDTSTPIDPVNDVVISTAVDFQLEAVAPDPYFAGYLYCAIMDNLAGDHYLYTADLNGTGYDASSLIPYLSLAPNQYDSNYVTGLAVFFDEYYNTNFLISFFGWERQSGFFDATFAAGVLKVDYSGGVYNTYPAEPFQLTSAAIPGDTSVPLDVAYENGRVYVLCAPVGGTPVNGVYPDLNYPGNFLSGGGRSDLWILDTDLQAIPDYAAPGAGVTTPYISPSATKNGKLLGPTRFIAPMREGKLYVGQWPDFLQFTSAYPWVSTIKLDGSGVVDGPVSWNVAN